MVIISAITIYDLGELYKYTNTSVITDIVSAIKRHTLGSCRGVSVIQVLQLSE